ncbi:MAG TPA: hypothetical protein DEB31_04505 [Clostridiales bacterium]|nr:hypothetical protein [Clostridiales bacterium]
MSIFHNLFQGDCGNHVHPFTGLSARESKEDVEKKLRTLCDAGIRSMVLLWSNPDRQGDVSLFNDETYWTHMQWIVQYCRQYGMTFMVQDAAPFPTGRADGWLDDEANAKLNKLYLAQRHLDVAGPLPNARFRFDLLTGTKITKGLFEGKGAMPQSGDRLVTAVAVKMNDERRVCAAPVDLTGSVEDGILYWDVPPGKWRVISIYETYNGGGRMGFMNLLDRASVALQIEAVYESHYAHLKDEIGKTWLGMFYDEPEVGNMEGFFFTQRVGTPQDLGGKPMDLPWSREAAERWADEQGQAGLAPLAYLWYDGAGDEHEPVRYRYLELVSRLIRDNYNAQVHEWCRKRGIMYIGHVLEDENSHSRLGVGAVHFFRAQAHQDMGGIDMIGNQMIPGKDYVQAWYGSPEGDGEFYHYGLAKLASSAGHISPDKKGRSICEIFAVYGALAGTRMRKSVMDHLFVNGITELIPVDPVFEHLDMAYSRAQNEYANRMCHLLTNTRPCIKTAILYHAESEWYQGDGMKFQAPAAILAKNQISYDVIPADVFSERAHYQTTCDNGLCINSNRYEALIIPETKALPRSVLDFITKEAGDGFPVFYINKYPTLEAETGAPVEVPHGKCVELNALAEAVGKNILPDLRVQGGNENLRYAHYVDTSGSMPSDVYMLYNQGDDANIKLCVPCKGNALKIDLMNLAAEWVHTSDEKDGCGFDIDLCAQEAILICFGHLCTPEGLEKTGMRPNARAATQKAVALSCVWNVLLESAGKSMVLRELKDLGVKGLYPRYTDKIIYETTLQLTELPAQIDLGDVHEAASLYINGVCAGIRSAPKYRFSTENLFVKGENNIRVEVYPNQGARALPEAGIAGVIEAVSAAAYCPLEPVGMLGPVRLFFQ